MSRPIIRAEGVNCRNINMHDHRGVKDEPIETAAVRRIPALRLREPRLSARVCGPWEVVRSAETGIGRRPGAYRRQCLCWAKFQYRSASDVVQVVAALAERGWSWLSRSSEAEHPPLLVPGERRRERASSLSAVRSRCSKASPHRPCRSPGTSNGRCSASLERLSQDHPRSARAATT